MHESAFGTERQFAAVQRFRQQCEGRADEEWTQFKRLMPWHRPRVEIPGLEATQKTSIVGNRGLAVRQSHR
jgi:hypothetical protein